MPRDGNARELDPAVSFDTAPNVRVRVALLLAALAERLELFALRLGEPREGDGFDARASSLVDRLTARREATR